ncbi:YciI family protein [Nonomuraea rubra]
MPKYLLIMRGTDESNAAMMADIDAMMVRTRQFIEEMAKAGVLLAAEGLDDPGQGVVVDFSGEAPDAGRRRAPSWNWRRGCAPTSANARCCCARRPR